MTAANKTEEKNGGGGTIGQRFRAAREALGSTPSEVAAATNMLEKHVKALENDDFASMGAAIYTKGFIKIYADYLNLPVQPIVDEYTRKYAPRPGSPQPQPVRQSRPAKPSKPKQPAQVGKKLQKGMDNAVSAAKKIPKPVLKMWLINGTAALILIALIVGITFGVRGCMSMAENRSADEVLIESATDAVIEEPPEPYINTQQ